MTEDVEAAVKCGVCGLPIHPQESGIRHFGFYTAHSEQRCVSLLRERLAEAETALSALEAKVEGVERERDEALQDRNAHAEHVRRITKEAEDGFAALELIDRCWEACGYPINRGLVTLDEQIAAMARQIEECAAAESRALALEAQLKEAREALESAANAHEKLLREWMYAPFPKEAQVLGSMSPPSGPFAEAVNAIVAARRAAQAHTQEGGAS
jgi:hypothetical protein